MTPKGLQTATPEPSTSSAIVAGRALMALGVLGTVVVGVPWFFLDAAQNAQRYVALRFGTGLSWVVAVIVLLVGAVMSVAIIRGTIKAYNAPDEKAGTPPPTASP